MIQNEDRVTEFLKWILETYMTIEDPDTGEISRVGNARNPFRYVNFDSEIAPPIYRGETDKLALPYEYTKRSRDWIFPPEEFLNKSSVGQFALKASHFPIFCTNFISIILLLLLQPEVRADFCFVAAFAETSLFVSSSDCYLDLF